MPRQWNLVENALLLHRLFCFTKFTFITCKKSRFIIFVFMKANNSLRINMPRALELISFFFLGHGPTYPISDLSGSAITRENCLSFFTRNFSSHT